MILKSWPVSGHFLAKLSFKSMPDVQKNRLRNHALVMKPFWYLKCLLWNAKLPIVENTSHWDWGIFNIFLKVKIFFWNISNIFQALWNWIYLFAHEWEQFQYSWFVYIYIWVNKNVWHPAFCPLNNRFWWLEWDVFYHINGMIYQIFR